METCSLNSFLEAVKPWMDRNYIRSVHVDINKNLVLNFADGVKNVYRIDDCTGAQLDNILADFEKTGILVVRSAEE